MLDWFAAIGGIIFVDLVLSGDNALVIGAAASKLPRSQRLWAIAIGGGGAIILRILFAIAATFLLQLPFLGIIGGAILLYIAVRLLLERSQEHFRTLTAGKAASSGQMPSVIFPRSVSPSFLSSIVTILVADATMSLDNVLAVGALANGALPFLVIGLLFSIILVLIGSAIVAELIGRLPWLLDVACLVLAWAASQILLGDDLLNSLILKLPWIQFAVPVAAIILVILADILLRRHFRLDRKETMSHWFHHLRR
ncbi:YjbE family putative metal transport protein [Tengunoibacter tsumagoiensis]|uniref:Tellurium resistance protein TerC n=1 Tax=Tengunoibacter tsumagoiensis TaxID=2014871 RepID=A0A402A5L9_9CHLR|nr:YjbE family putative metal transport protein [Tengunoibacter tsumagoiensis]GCE14434.1 hypothetical protein KTT_42930 [Tengunoibacter tsumagoiensis]